MSIKAKTGGEFDKLYGVLNAPQKKAVDSIEGPVMVIAGPGTGKTTILTLRIANIIKTTDTSPENILALTFTESGAFAMRRKLVEIIGPAAYKVNIHTFHGFATHIIEQYPDYFPRIIGSSVITDAEQIKIIETIIQSRKIDLLRPYGDPSYYVKPILHEIHILKRENVSPKQLLESIRSEDVGDGAGIVRSGRVAERARRPRSDDAGSVSISKAEGELSATEIEKLKKQTEKNLELAYVYGKYEEELRDKKYYDFDDMLLELIRAMEGNDSFKLILQESYHYILADEHQDANASQNRILELLADFHDSPNLFIVGDDKQAIYRFQGASLENFLYFSRKYPSAEIIELTHNYRSHQGILDASHGVISNNPAIPDHAPVRLVSLQVGTKPVFVDEFKTADDELEHLAVVIERLIGKGEKAEEIAVLYRENKHAQALAAILRAHNIAHRIESDNNILGEIDPLKAIILSRAINDPSNDEALAKALLLPEMKCDPARVSELCSYARKENVPLHSVISSLNSPKKGNDIPNQSRAHLNAKEFSDVSEAYRRLVAWSGEAQVLQYPDFLQKLIQETGMLASIASAPDSLDRLTSLQAMFDRVCAAAASKKTFYLRDFIEYLDIIDSHGINSRRNFADHIGGVRLMTAHRAKGLEFNHVFIIHVIDGSWGNRSKRALFNIPVIEHARDMGRIEDERRLFYVAMTRARESVTVSYAKSHAGKESVPSQFIAEIEARLISFEKPEVGTLQAVFAKKMEAPKASKSAILSPDFVRSKFLSQPFSVTHLNNYLECAWKYFFVNLIRVPQAPTKHQMYGTAIHSALRIFFDGYKEERDLSKRQLVELFKHYLDMQPMAVYDREDSFKKGKDALEGYFKEYVGTWNRKLLTEYAIRGVVVDLETAVNSKTSTTGDMSAGGGTIRSERVAERARRSRSDSDAPESAPTLELTGKLDKVEFIDENRVNVVDYKTAKPKSRNDIEGKTKDANGNYKRQLVFYKLLIDGDRKFSMKSGEIDFIEPNERGKYKKESFEIAEKEVQELRQVIIDSAKGILGLSFVNSSCSEKDCEYCALGKLLSKS